MIKRTFLALTIAFLLCSLTGITLISWDFAGNAGSETTATANVFAANISSLTPSGVISRGLGLSAPANADRFNAANWGQGTLADAIANQDYIQFSILPATGYVLNLTALHLRMQRSSTGPVSFTFRSNFDDYAANIGSFSVSTATTTGIEQTIPVSGITLETAKVTFRMYGIGATNTAGSAGFEGTGVDLEILGSVVANFTAPSVTTTACSGITHYGCTAGGNVTSDGGSPLSARGIVVSTQTYPVIGAAGVINIPAATTATGAFSVNVTGLLAHTGYYVCAYATNQGGTTYGTQTSFTTLSFPAPLLLPATNITNLSFRANWQPVTNAVNYRLDVADSPVFTGASSSVLFTEPFNAGVSAPAGWTFSGIAATYTSSGYFGLAAPSIKFDDTNDTVTTLNISQPSTLSFWIKGTSTSGASAFTIEEYYAGLWHEVATLTPLGVGMNLLPTSGATRSFALDAASTQIRFSYFKEVGNVGLDDVVVSGNAIADTYVTGYRDLLVNATSQNVTGLAQDHTYYYRVRAYSSAGELSANSEVSSVRCEFSGTVAPPAYLTATAVNASTVSLQWGHNPAGDNVLLAFSTTNTFGTPAGSYIPGAAIPGGGTVIYNGSNLVHSQNGLNPSTHYYYQAWSVDSANNYSAALSAEVSTPAGSSETIKVHYIDVRQGDSILIQRGGANYLIDSGKDLTDNKLVTYLQSQNVTHLDACLITHPDFDHYGEFMDLVRSNAVTTDRFVKNSDAFTSISGLALMDTLAARNIPVDIVNASTVLNWSIDTEILNPQPTRLSENDNSIVLKMLYGNVSFLFTGDIEYATNASLINNYDMNIDVLKVSHHGSINGTTAAFLAEATPAISVISTGNNSFGHPSYSVISMLQAIGSLTYSTADDWNTWTGNGSSDLTEDDDIILETDGTNIWKNGTWVWSAPTGSLTAPQNITIGTAANLLTLSWINVPTALSYRVYASDTYPWATYTDISSTGSFTVNAGRTIWTAPVSPANLRRFYQITALK